MRSLDEHIHTIPGSCQYSGSCHDQIPVVDEKIHIFLLFRHSLLRAIAILLFQVLLVLSILQFILPVSLPLLRGLYPAHDTALPSAGSKYACAKCVRDCPGLVVKPYHHHDKEKQENGNHRQDDVHCPDAFLFLHTSSFTAQSWQIQ